MSSRLTNPFAKTLADEQLEARLEHDLAALSIPSLRFLSVTASRGVVTLRGRVRSYHHRQLASLACRRVVGVENLIDLVSVDEIPHDDFNDDINAVAPPLPPAHGRASLALTALTLTSLTLALLATTGCSGDGRIPVVPVKGTLAYEGKPIPGAMVVLHPTTAGQEAGEAAAVRPLGHVAPDGSFELSTYGQRDGAPVGEYTVTVEWRTPKKVGGDYLPGDNRLPARYSRPETSNLKVQVAEGVATLPKLELSRR